METGAPIATFIGDAAACFCAFVADHQFIAGDAGGHVRFLRLEEPKCKERKAASWATPWW